MWLTVIEMKEKAPSVSMEMINQIMEMVSRLVIR